LQRHRLPKNAAELLTFRHPPDSPASVSLAKKPFRKSTVHDLATPQAPETAKSDSQYLID
jgi:hypothetical protein